MKTNYETALEIVREASRKFMKVQADYRARKIGDKEYLAARAEYEKADAAFEAVAAENV